MNRIFHLAFLMTLPMTMYFTACTKEAPSSSGDEDEEFSESSSAKAKSSSSGGSEKAKSSSDASDDIDEDCVGTPGEPWDGTTAKDFACGAGTKLSPYIILTAEQLAHLSFIVGAQESSGKYFKLGADILLNKGEIIDDKGALVADSTKLHKWTPIGNSSVMFAGVFDGDGHTVSGMFINTTSSHNGLFGNVSGTVQNVTVENGWVKGGNNTAGVVGVLKGEAFVKNVLNRISVTGTGESAAGVVGSTDYVYDKKGTIDSAINRGIIKGAKNAGGIVAAAGNVVINNVENHALIEGGSKVGGIAGSLGSSSDLKKAFNDGEIIGKECIAGIAGYFGSSYCPNNKNYGMIKNASNHARISGTNYVAGIVGEAQCVTIATAGNVGDIEGNKYVAGIDGHSERTKNTSIYNTGDIFGTSRVGGIIGYNEEGVTSSAYSTGKVVGDSLVGLMIGYNYNTTMADYYYLEQGEQEPFGLNNGGGVATPKTEKEMKSEEFAELLGEDFTYDSGLNDGYPVLEWEEEE